MRAKAIPLVLIGAIALGSYALSPAIGGGLFTKKKARNLFYTKSEVYTKSEADQRFNPAGSSYPKSETYTKAETYSRAEADARYPSSSGQTRVTVGALSAEVKPGSTHTLERFSVAAIYSTTAAASGQGALVPLYGPVQLFGAGMKVIGVEYCYATDIASVLGEVSIRSHPATAANPVQGDELLANDGTDRTDDACRTLTLSSPQPIVDESLFLEMNVGYIAAGEFSFLRATLILSP